MHLSQQNADRTFVHQRGWQIGTECAEEHSEEVVRVHAPREVCSASPLAHGRSVDRAHLVRVRVRVRVKVRVRVRVRVGVRVSVSVGVGFGLGLGLGLELELGLG